MSLSITSVARENGAACDHVTAVVDHEGVSRTFRASFSEIDALVGEMTPLEQLRMLVLLWAKYRRQQSRPLTGVVIG